MHLHQELRATLAVGLLLALAACGGGQQAAVTDNVSVARAAAQQIATLPANAASAADRRSRCTGPHATGIASPGPPRSALRSRTELSRSRIPPDRPLAKTQRSPPAPTAPTPAT